MCVCVCARPCTHKKERGERQTDRHAQTQTDRQTKTQTDRQKDRQTETERQIDRQTETERDSDRQTDRQNKRVNELLEEVDSDYMAAVTAQRVPWE